MADDYTPTTAEIRKRASSSRIYPAFPSPALEAEFDRWLAEMLAAHDAQKRVEWEAEQGEMEYGFGWRYIDGSVVGVRMSSRQDAEDYIRNVPADESPEDYFLVRRAPERLAGLWLPVPDTT